MNNFGGFQATKKRTRQPIIGSGGDRRKECRQGVSCPFQHEYQHNLEFSHSSQPLNAATGALNERVRSTTQSNQGNSLATASSTFSGKGNKLGGSQVLVPDRSRFLSLLESQYRPLPSNATIPKQSNFSSSSSSNVIDLTSPQRSIDHGSRSVADHCSSDQHVYCDNCGKNILIHDFEEHLQLHEMGAIYDESPTKSSDISSSKEPTTKFRRSYTGDRLLKGQQDDEYEESMIKEIEEKSAIEHERQLSKEEEIKMQEEAALIESQREAFRLKQLEQHQLAKLRVPPEPSDICGDDLVSLRFTLLSGRRITRRFRKDSSMQEVFTFLKTIEELIHIKYELKTVIGNVVFHEKMTETLKEVGLTSNTNLVLVIIDITDAMINEILNDGCSSPLAIGRHRKLQKRDDSANFTELQANFNSMAFPSAATNSSNQRKRCREQVIDLT